MKKEVVNVRSQEEWDYVTEKLGYNWSYKTSWEEYRHNSIIDINELGFTKINCSSIKNYYVISFNEFKQRYEPNTKENLIKQYIPKDKWKEFGIEEDIVLRDWEELDFENSFYPEFDGQVIDQTTSVCSDTMLCLNVPTEKHAKSMIAFAKLSMLMADLVDECKVDWSDEKENKFIISNNKNKLHKGVMFTRYYFLAFKTEKIRDAFYDKHEQLIKEYEML